MVHLRDRLRMQKRACEFIRLWDVAKNACAILAIIVIIFVSFFSKLFFILALLSVKQYACILSKTPALIAIPFTVIKCFRRHETITVLNCHLNLNVFFLSFFLILTIMLKIELCNYK